MATYLRNLSEYDFSKVPDASNMCFGIVVAEWNPEITGKLLEGCVSTLEKHGTLPENIQKFSGRGVYLIRELSDKAEFLEGGTLINMYFNLKN